MENVSGSIESGAIKASETSLDIPIILDAENEVSQKNNEVENIRETVETKELTHAKLTIERGVSIGEVFSLGSEESNIGRWDADNGIFPDVDLDAHDPEAKISRKHARIVLQDNIYFVEDLGSTNGTFVNRGRRLLPGNRENLKDGDEIIVGKTFLRFKILT